MRKHLTDSSSVEGFLAEFVMNATNTICQICDGKTNHSFEGVHLHFGRKKDGLVAVFESKFPFHHRHRSLFLPG